MIQEQREGHERMSALYQVYRTWYLVLTLFCGITFGLMSDLGCGGKGRLLFFSSSSTNHFFYTITYVRVCLLRIALLLLILLSLQ